MSTTKTKFVCLYRFLASGPWKPASEEAVGDVRHLTRI
jgi:hypothetical protein